MTRWTNCFPLLYKTVLVWVAALCAVNGHVSAQLTDTVLELELPTVREDGQWDLTWGSTSGKTYRIERTAELTAITWTHVANVTAAGSSTTYVVSEILPPAETVMFWRVLELGDGSIGPTVSTLKAYAVAEANGSRTLMLEVTVTDDVGVMRTDFLDSSTPDESSMENLPGDVANDQATWRIEAGNIEEALDRPYFQARALDVEGNEGRSPVQGFALVDPDRLEAIDPETGNSLPGQLVPMDADGNLRPFAYRPGGASPLGRQGDFRILYPEGARLVQGVDGMHLEFTEAMADFGRDSPIQLVQALTKSGGSIARLSLEKGEVDVASLVAAFGLDEETGIPVVLQGQQAGHWKAGRLMDYGIESPVIEVDSMDLPLPANSSSYQGGAISFFDSTDTRIPFYGELELPGVPQAPRILVPENNPIWLSVHANGTLALSGPVEVEFADGTRLRAALRLDDPYYSFGLSTDNVPVEMIQSLSTSLPPDPSARIGALGTKSELAQAVRQLNQFLEAYTGYAQTATSLAASNPENLGFELAIPSESSLGPLASLLQSASRTSQLSSISAEGISALESLCEVIGRQSSSQSATDKLAILTFLKQLILATESGNLQGNPSLEVALDEAATVVHGDIPADWESTGPLPAATEFIDAMEQLVYLEEVATALGGVSIAQHDGIRVLIQRKLERYGDQLGTGALLTGNDYQNTGPVIAEYGRRQAFGEFESILFMLEQAEAAGMEFDAGTTLLDEYVTVLALAVETHALQAIVEAEATLDSVAFRLALEEYILVHRLRYLDLISGLSSARGALPEVGEVDAVLERHAELETEDPQGLSRAHSAVWHAAELAAFRLLVTSAPEARPPAGPMNRALAASGRMLDPYTDPANLWAFTTATDLRLLIETGVQRELLAVDGSLSLTDNWLTINLPVALERFVEISQLNLAWGDAIALASFLLAEARTCTEIDELALAATLTNAAAQVLEALESAARRSWQQEESRRELAADLPEADLVLPGGLELDSLYGYLSYNRRENELAGGFGGTLRFPQFNGSLTVSSGEFVSDGSLAMTAYGTMRFPPADGASSEDFVTITVPESSPIRVLRTPDGRLELEGTAQFALSNGMTFTASAAFLHPYYRFSFEASGLAFKFLKGIVPNIPAFTIPSNRTNDPDAYAIWADLYQSFGEATGSLNVPASPEDQASFVPGPVEEEAPPLVANELVTLQLMEDVIFVNLLADTVLDPDSVGTQLADLIIKVLDETRINIEAAMEAEITTLEPSAMALSGGDAVALPADNPTPMLVQIDFGNGAVYTGAGPAHADGYVPDDDREFVWHAVDANRTLPTVPNAVSVLHGVMDEGLFLDGGFALSDWISFTPDPQLSPVTYQRSTAGLNPIFRNPLFEDGMRSRPSFPNAPLTRYVVGITGLPEGNYGVYALSMLTADDLGNPITSDQIIQFGYSDSNDTFLTTGVQLDANAVQLDSWSRNRNFANSPQIIMRENRDLLIVAGAGNNSTIRNSGATYGYLSGLQVVQLVPKVVLFTASPSSNPENPLFPGTEVTLRWKTRHATKVTFDPPKDTKISANGRRVVRPQSSTTYEITVTDGVFSETVRLNVYVDGQIVIGQVTGAIKLANDKLAAISGIISELEQAGFETLTPEAEQAIEEALNGASGIMEEVFDNPNLAKDDTATQAAIAASLNFEQISQLLGFEQTGLVPRSTEAAENSLDNLNSRFLNADGSLDQEKINSLSNRESGEQMRKLISATERSELLGGQGSGSASATGISAALARNASLKAMQEGGYNPESGQWDFSGVSNDTLAQVSSKVLEGIKAYQSLGGNDVAVETDPGQILPVVAGESLRRALEAEPKLKPGDMVARWEVISLTDYARNSYAAVGENDNALEIQSILDRQAPLFIQEAAAAGGARLGYREAQVMTIGSRAIGNSPAAKAALEMRLTQVLTATSQDIARSWTTDDLDLGENRLADLLEIEEFIREYASLNFPLTIDTQLQPRTLLPQLAVRLKEATTDAEDTKRAGRMMARLAAAAKALNVSVPAATNALEEEINLMPQTVEAVTVETLLAAAQTIGEGISPIVLAKSARISETNNPLDGLGFLGDLTIDRISGSLEFNTETGYVRGDLGGRITLPESNFYLDVTRGSIDSDGSFALELTSGGLIPVGGNDRIQFNVLDFTVDGNIDGSFAFNTDASLRIRTGDEPTDFYQLGLGLSYDTTTDRLKLGNGTTPIQLPLDEDLALLEGNIEVDFSTASPMGALTLSGTLGILSRGIEREAGTPFTQEDFWLVIDSNPTTFAYDAEGISAEFTGGALLLAPDLFYRDAPEGTEQVRVSLEGTLCMRMEFATGQVTFCDTDGEPYRLALDNFQLALPDLPGFRLDIDNTSLLLDGAGFPILENLEALLILPLPGSDSTDIRTTKLVSLSITGQNWRIDGLPEAASIYLASDLTFIDLEGFTVTLLDGSEDEVAGCPPGLSFFYDEDADKMGFALAGQVRAALEGDLLADESGGAGVGFTAGGCFSWVIGQLPAFHLDDTFTIEGRFRLGGTDGLLVRGTQASRPPQELARVTIRNLDNIFIRSEQDPFILCLSGALDIQDFVEVGLNETCFVWDGTVRDPISGDFNNFLPRFEPGELYAIPGSESIDLVDGLPLYPTFVGLSFFDNTKPLIPEDGEWLLDPTNILLRLSGVIQVPSGEALEAGSPGFFGAVENALFSLRKDGFLYIPEVDLGSVTTLALSVENLDIPPLGGITGSLGVGNIDDPPNMFFAGQVAGEFNGAGVEILLAASFTEILGACFAVNAGPAGIPIDGGFLGGVLLTGAKGGISFGNQFADPCDFASYFNLTPPQPPLAPGPDDPEASVIPDDFDGGAFSCITDPFPGPTINPFCERLEGTDRIIYKGSSISRTQFNSILNTLGIPDARAHLESLVPGEIVDEVTTTLVDDLRIRFDDGITALAGPARDTPIAEYLVAQGNNFLGAFEDTLRGVLRQTLAIALQDNPDDSVYDIVTDRLALGIECFDVTQRMEGTISHAAVSTVFNLTGGMTQSTTGTVSADGTLNMIGIPVGQAQVAFSLTNSAGDIDPAFGGYAQVALGPLELGGMSMALQCDGCLNVVTTQFAILLACLLDEAGQQAVDFGYDMLDRAIRQEGGWDRDTPLLNHFLDLNSQEQLAYVSSFFSLFTALGNGEPLPDFFNAEAAGAFRECFLDFMVAVLPEVNPFICFNGEVKPSIFGFPLSGGAETAFSATVLYGRTEGLGDQVSEEMADNLTDARGSTPDGAEQYQEFIASTEFSPTFLLLAPIMGPAAFGQASDMANIGVSFRVPALTKASARQMFDDPGAFLSSQFNTFLNDAVFSFGYAFQPLGIPLTEGQGRLIFPRLESHPLNPARIASDPWINPDTLTIDQDGEAVPDPKVLGRSELILMALSRGQLKNPRWRGTAEDLAALVRGEVNPGGYKPTEGSCDALNQVVADRILTVDPDLTWLSGKSLGHDFFPHGGFIGGAEMSLLNVIAQTPPWEQLTSLVLLPDLQDSAATQAWVENLVWLFENYLTGTTCTGQLAFYLPAPNPLGLEFAESEPMEMFELIGSVFSDDGGSQFGDLLDRTFPDNLIETDLILLQGWMDTPILGLPVAQGAVLYDPAAQCFSVNASVLGGIEGGQDNWLYDLVGAELLFEIKSPDALGRGTTPGPEEALRNLAMQFGIDPGVTDTSVPGFVDEIVSRVQGGSLAVGDLTNSLKASLPKVQASASAFLNVPPDLSQFLREQADTGTGGGLEMEFFMFSPEFQPGYMPEDFRPYAEARRRGGMGLRGALEFYYDGPGVPGEIVFLVNDASLAFTPDQDIGIFPQVKANLEVDEFIMPGYPQMRSGRLAYDSDPSPGGYHIIVQGEVEPFSFGLFGAPLLSFNPLNPGDSFIGGSFVIQNDAITETPQVRLELDAVSATMPLLGTGVGLTLYNPPAEGQTEFQPINFSTASGESWSARVAISNPVDPEDPPVFGICDPRAPGSSDCFLTFTPTGPVTGSIEGVGLEQFKLLLEIPYGMTATFYPGKETETSLTINAPDGADPDDKAILYIDSDGRFYVDFGMQEGIGLPGVMTASGRLEFGFNPGGDIALVTLSESVIDFGTLDLTETGSDSFDVTNIGTAQANVQLQSSSPDEFLVSDSAFALGPGESRTVSVVYQPGELGQREGTIQVSSNGVPALQTVTLSATATAQPRYFQSRGRVDFAVTALGSRSVSSITIGNEGSAPLEIDSIQLVNGTASDRFALDGGTNSTVILQPGETRLLNVTFQPDEEIDYSTAIIVVYTLGTGPGSAVFHNIQLTGSGGPSQWITLLDEAVTGSSATLRDIDINDAGTGLVVGDSGTFLETNNGGVSWTPRNLTTVDLHAVARSSAAPSAPVIAAYHFEDPPGSLNFRDSGPNGWHAYAGNDNPDNPTPDPNHAPGLIYASGTIGQGLAYDNSGARAEDDWIELGDLEVGRDFAVSFWVYPFNTGNQFFIGKNSSSGNNHFLFGFFNGNLRLDFRGVAWNLGSPSTGWQHFVVNGDYNESGGETTMTVFRNGSQIGQRVFDGSISNAGRRWTLGMEWDGDIPSDHVYGYLDEVLFFGRPLTTGEISGLSNTVDRMVVAGEKGVALQSFTQGADWQVVPDIRVAGWNSGSGSLVETNYASALLSGGDLILGGHTKSFGILSPVVLWEGLDGDRFGSATLTLSNADWLINETINSMSVSSFGASTYVYAGTSRGRVFREYSLDFDEDTFFQHGDFLGDGINDMIRTNGSGGYLGVGDGALAFSTGSGAVDPVVSGSVPAGTGDIEALTAVDIFDFYGVGEAGLFFKTDSTATNWDIIGNGLTGHNFAIDTLNQVAGQHIFFVAGEGQRIQRYKQNQEIEPAFPFLTFYPGELDFEQVGPGESRTLRVRIDNRGQADLPAQSLSLDGPAFSVESTSLPSLSPGEFLELQVTYVAGAAASHDLGTLMIGQHALPLKGQTRGQGWQPVLLRLGSSRVDGSVIDLERIPVSNNLTIDGYLFALVENGNERGLLVSSNNGTTWSNITPDPLPAFEKLIINDIATGPGARLVVMGKQVAGKTTEGFVWVSDNNGQSFMPYSPPNCLEVLHGDLLEADPDGETILVSGTDSSGVDQIWYNSVLAQIGTIPSVTWNPTSTRVINNYSANPVWIEATDTGTSQFGARLIAQVGTGLHQTRWQTAWPTASTAPFDGQAGIEFRPGQAIRDFKAGHRGSQDWEYAWLVGDEGLYWFWYSGGGDATPFYNDTLDWIPAASQGTFGTTDLKAIDFDSDNRNGYIISETGIYTSTNRGYSWERSRDFGEATSLESVLANEPDKDIKAWVGGQVANRAMIWRYQPALTRTVPVLSTVDAYDFAEVDPGGNHVTGIILRNIGDAPLELGNTRINSADPQNRFSHELLGGEAVAPGSSSGLILRFDAQPDPLDIERLAPAVFLRFEQNWGDTVFADSSGNLRHAEATSPNEARHPTVFEDPLMGRRSRCLKFDGDDYAFIIDGPESFDHTNDYTISTWVYLSSADDQAFYSKSSLDGVTDFLRVGFFDGQYEVAIRGESASGGEFKEGWQHLILRAAHNPALGVTAVTLLRDGEKLIESILDASTSNMSGRYWLLGADTDFTSRRGTIIPTINSEMVGMLDDFAIFERELNEHERNILASSSPMCGLHTAQVHILSNSFDGDRTLHLRAQVGETTRMTRIESHPVGLPVSFMVDGQSTASGTGFATRCHASVGQEWNDESRHRIEAPALITDVDADGNTVTYRFAGWNVSAERSFLWTARLPEGSDPSPERLIARYVPLAVESPSSGQLLALTEETGNVPDPILSPLDVDFDISTALRGTGNGPFIRLSDGALSLGGATGDSFDITGELFVNLTTLNASLFVDSFRLPATGNPLISMGASSFILDMVAGDGGHFYMKATPPSLSLLDYDVAMAAELELSLFSEQADPANKDTFIASFTLKDDFRPLPDVVEFPAGGVKLTVEPGPLNFTLEIDAGLRFLKLPSELDTDGWVINENTGLVLSTADFDLSLAEYLELDTLTFIDAGPFTMEGDARLKRAADGSIVAGLDIDDFSYNGSSMGTLTADVSTSGSFELSGTASNSALSLLTGGGFTLENRNSGNLAYDLYVGLSPTPRFILELPPSRLKSTAAGFPAGGINVPGLEIDTSGDFDTDKIPLTLFDFDGINLVSTADDEEAETPYLRLSRRNGLMRFETFAYVNFLFVFPQEFNLAIEGRSVGTIDVDASVSGTFGLPDFMLREPATLIFDSGSSCQFSGSAGDFDIYFGSGCGGVCLDGNSILGTCP